MHILAIDTATNSGGVSLGRNGEVIGVAMLKTPLRYSEAILHYVDFLLRQHALKLSQIDCFAVATGPGSFTGLRIGLATAKAFSKGLQTPVAGISTLEALAYRFRHLGGLVAPLIDARRQQVYAAVYRAQDMALSLQQPEAVAAPADWLKRLQPAPYWFVGDGVAHCRTALAALHPGAHLLDTDNSILYELCQLAYRRVIEGTTISGDQIQANYLRPSDVRRPSTP